jgi:hypothetical protein
MNLNIESFSKDIQYKNILNTKMIDINHEKSTCVDKKDALNSNRHKRPLSPGSSRSSTSSSTNTNKTFEPKRTANLENLIGNLKVRKMNQSSTSSKNSSNSSKNGKMSSLYVDVASTSLSDCSRTPPLSSSAAASPSISPSSISPDSPVQSQISSLSSSSSSLARSIATSSSNNENKSNYSIVTKFRLMMDNNDDKNIEKIDTNNLQKKNEKITKENFENVEDELEDSDTYNDDENQMKLVINEIENENIYGNKKSNTVNINNKKSEHKLNSKKHANNKNVNTNVKNSSNSKNQDDPSKAIKFYDDYIDFRGDILRRPPNSKNCRILWEYLFLLLQDNNYSSVIKWEDDVNMVFRIVQAEKLAALWGKIKFKFKSLYF